MYNLSPEIMNLLNDKRIDAAHKRLTEILEESLAVGNHGMAVDTLVSLSHVEMMRSNDPSRSLAHIDAALAMVDNVDENLKGKVLYSRCKLLTNTRQRQRVVEIPELHENISWARNAEVHLWLAHMLQLRVTISRGNERYIASDMTESVQAYEKARDVESQITALLLFSTLSAMWDIGLENAFIDSAETLLDDLSSESLKRMRMGSGRLTMIPSDMRLDADEAPMVHNDRTYWHDYLARTRVWIERIHSSRNQQ